MVRDGGIIMKERLKTLFMLLLVATMSVAVAGCSSDDDEDGGGSGGSGITGTWYSEIDVDGGYTVLRFDSDNTFSMDYIYGGQTYDSESGEYMYDSEGGTLVLFFDYGETERVSVTISGGVMMAEGERFTRERPSAGGSAGDDDHGASSIVGTWRHSFSTGYITMRLTVMPELSAMETAKSAR